MGPRARHPGGAADRGRAPCCAHHGLPAWFWWLLLRFRAPGINKPEPRADGEARPNRQFRRPSRLSEFPSRQVRLAGQIVGCRTLAQFMNRALRYHRRNANRIRTTGRDAAMPTPPNIQLPGLHHTDPLAATLRHQELQRRACCRGRNVLPDRRQLNIASQSIPPPSADVRRRR